MIIALFVILVTTQSFYSKPEPKRLYDANTRFPLNVSMCGGAIFLPKDSALTIPALKGWGNYKWKVTTLSDSAQYYFNQGISMYYGFHAIEAIASFEKATRFDPEFAMGWYGKALAMGPTINEDWGYSAPADALKAALKSKELSGNCNALEKDLIEAIQYRYRADTVLSLIKLRENYASAMEKVYMAHQNNADAVTLYADSRLLLHPWDLYDHEQKPKSWTPEIRKLLEHAIVLSPKHPGANHYYIHTMEASAQPELAIKSANLLDTLMPSVAHITHMPSHIYIRTGEYQRAVKVNDDAIAGYKQYLKDFAPVSNNVFLYEIHALHLQSASAQMAGNYNTSIGSAVKLSKGLVKAGALSMKGALGNYMQYCYSTPLLTDVRFGKWDKILAIQPTDTLLFADILLHFGKGIAYGRKHQLLLAKNELNAFKIKMADKSLKADAVLYSSASAICKVAEPILSGVIAEEEGNLKQAVNFFQQAVVAETNLTYNEPRDWPLPAREYLGDALLKSSKFTEAIEIFKKDLMINPINGWSLTGLSIAYQKTGNLNLLNSSKNQLRKAWTMKDVVINRAVL